LRKRHLAGVASKSPDYSVEWWLGIGDLENGGKIMHPPQHRLLYLLIDTQMEPVDSKYYGVSHLQERDIYPMISPPISSCPTSGQAEAPVAVHENDVVMLWLIKIWGATLFTPCLDREFVTSRPKVFDVDRWRMKWETSLSYPSVFLLLGFWVSSLNLLVTASFTNLSMSSLPFGSFLGIKISREAVCAEMLVGDFLAVVKAFDMLPSVTFWARDGVIIVICENAYTLEGVFSSSWIFLSERELLNGGAAREGAAVSGYWLVVRREDVA
jgi:hypothetical protein